MDREAIPKEIKKLKEIGEHLFGFEHLFAIEIKKISASLDSIAKTLRKINKKLKDLNGGI